MANKSNHPTKLSECDVQKIVRKYTRDSTVTTSSLATEYGCSNVTISKVLRKNIDADVYRKLKLSRNPTYPGEESVKRKREEAESRSYAFRHRVNHECFSGKITAEKAYWIGFLLSDGCVYQNRIQLGLNQRDIEHVRKFQQFVSGDFYQIQKVESNKSCNLRFVSRQMAEDLGKYGVVPRKSLTDAFAQNIPQQYIPHYLRGVFDGDGSVHKERRKNGRLIVQVPGSYLFCERLMECLKTLGIHAVGPYMNKKSSMCSVQIQSANAVLFLDMIYRYACSSMRLSRKYEKYRSLTNYGIVVKSGDDLIRSDKTLVGV